MDTKMSILLATLNVDGLIIGLIPSINKILEILDPIILPIAISVFLLKAVIA